MSFSASKLWRMGSLLLALSSPACDSESNGCPDGSETCPCTVDYKCLEGLTCLSDRCVDVSWTPPEDEPDPAGPDGTADNRAACEEWVDSLQSLQCGLQGGQSVVDCSAYANVPCDLNANGLFACFSDNVTCQGGMLDASGLASCAALATCE